MPRWPVWFILLLGCAAHEREFAFREFPLREPMTRDTDLASVNVHCRVSPTPKDPKHVTCAPEPYTSPLYWDGADNLFFRPLSNALGVVTSHESVDVNSLDEVPDSAWFTNRLGKRSMTPREIALGACNADDILDPDHATDGSWVIDKGKTDGSTPGFRITVPGKGKYLLKAESIDDEPERQAAASVIGAAVYHAAGYYTSCEQVVYVRRSVFKLMPGLRAKANFEEEKPFDRRALDAIFAKSPRRGELVRFSASSWVPGFGLGAFRYDGTREDDPNDVIDHENRRELRGARLLAAWIDRFDAREGNSLDSWRADVKKGPPDASPGHIIHYQLDTSEVLGSLWAWDAISRRLGYSYVIDWGDIATDFFTLGIPLRTWDVLTPHPTFGYFDVDHFDAERWKNEYPNAAFTRMTERDGAWMARILARFTPEMIDALATAGNFTRSSDATYLARVLRGRLEKILARYLTYVSPLTDVRVNDGELCAVDLAERRGVRPAASFHYDARVVDGAALGVTRREGGEVCVALSHSPRRYVRIMMRDGVAKAPLVAHLYDLGAEGFRLAGLERPTP